MIDSRDAILEQLQPLMEDFIKKAKNGRIRDEQKAKIRISYANALASLIRAYSSLLKDKELEELSQQLEELKDEFKQSKNRN